MKKYIGRRLLQLIPIILGITFYQHTYLVRVCDEVGGRRGGRRRGRGRLVGVLLVLFFHVAGAVHVNVET